MSSALIVGSYACLGAYLLGNIPFSVFVARSAGFDLYTTGSKNPGASNVARVAGWKWGALAMMLDILKGFIPPLMVFLLVGHHFSNQTTRIIAYCAAGSAIAGHVIPIGRKGGKGIATGAGAALVLVPDAGLVMLVVWILCMKIIKYPVLASILAAAILPIWLVFDQNYMWEFVIATGLFVFVVLRHTPNLIRLARREESAVTKHGRKQYQQEN